MLFPKHLTLRTLPIDPNWGHDPPIDDVKLCSYFLEKKLKIIFLSTWIVLKVLFLCQMTQNQVIF